MSKKRQQRERFSDQLRRIIRECGMSRYRISKETGISQQTLSRFMSGERGLTMAALDTLAEFLGLNVTADDRSTKRKRN